MKYAAIWKASTRRIWAPMEKRFVGFTRDPGGLRAERRECGPDQAMVRATVVVITRSMYRY